MDIKEKYNWGILETEVKHLKELMSQHDKLTELAISKSEANYNERFAKNNEFREQLKDMIATLARQKEVDGAVDSLLARIDQDKKAATERYELALRSTHDKIDMQGTHLSNMLEAAKKEFTEKREAAIKSVEEKIILEIKSRDDKFSNIDNQMRILIDSNAEVSNKGISDLVKQVAEINKRNDNTEGRMFIINRFIGILISIVVALVIAFIITFFR